MIRNESSSSEMDNENEDELGHHRQCRDLTLEELQKRFPEIINQKHRVEDSIACEICLQLISEDHDQMVICEGCLGAVHQSCYRMEIEEEVPEEDWIC